MDKVDWSKAPEDATHAAPAESYGRVCWYKDIIGKSAYRFMYSHGTDSDEWQPGVCGLPIHRPLEPRPQPDNKEGEGVGWEPGADLPPVGIECEVKDMVREWIKVEVIAHFGEFAVYCYEGHPRQATAKHFRAPKSRREKVIEAAKVKYFDPISHECPPLENKWLDRLFGAMVDDGSLKLPGEES